MAQNKLNANFKCTDLLLQICDLACDTIVDMTLYNNDDEPDYNEEEEIATQ